MSVVIPCFNYGRFVAAAVDSVLAQTFQDLEILVVDGGSDDPESLAALRELRRPKTTILYREQRHMVGDNRNFGIDRARGKYVCCLDPDDLLRPTYLEKAIYRLETEGYDLVSTWYEQFGAESGLLQLLGYPTLADMISGNHVATCAVFRRTLWEEAGGFVDTGRGSDYVYEDWRLWIRCAALGARIANLREPLMRYRVHPTSLSQGPEVRPLPAQREAILALEPMVAGEEAHRRSAARQRQVIEVEDALCNLLPRQAPDSRPTILLAVPFLLVGGVERLFSQLCAHLRRRGYRIVIVSSLTFDPAYGDSSAWFADATDEIFRLPCFLEPDRWRAFVDYLLESRRVQLLWIVGSAFFYDLLPGLKAGHPQLRVIDSLFNTVGHTTNNRKHRECIDLNLVENEEVARWLLEAGEEAGRVRLIPSGIDLERYRPVVKDPVALARCGLTADDFVVGFSGRLAVEKVPQRFVALADRLRDDSRLAFLMTGAGPLEGQVRTQVQGLRPGHRLQLLGNVHDVQEVLGLYDVLVLPSSLDGRPVVVLESLAMGIPVVASRVGGLPELVRDGETGFLCEPGDFEGFVRRIRWLANHLDEHARMKLAARRFAVATLGDAAMHAAYEAVLQELLATAAGAGQSTPALSGSGDEEELREPGRGGLGDAPEQRAQA